MPTRQTLSDLLGTACLMLLISAVAIAFDHVLILFQ